MDYEILIERFTKKEAGALEDVYDAFSAALFGVIRRMVHDQAMAEDVLQETFVKIWKNADRYDARKGRLYSWMHRIAVTTAINYTNRRSSRVHDRLDDVKSSEASGIQKLNIDVLDLRGKVFQLKPPQKQVIDLVYFQGFTQQEASDLLKLPLGTVKTRCRIALRELRKIYLSAPVAAALGRAILVLSLCLGL